MGMIIVGCVALLISLRIGWEPFRIRMRRRKLESSPFPDAWRMILRRHVPYFWKLTADLQLQLKRRIQVFIAEKEFIGCDGLEVTDQIKVIIAAQACLLLLNRHTDYFPGLRQILVYPEVFVVNKTGRDHNGLVFEQSQALSGESWTQGKVILAWTEVLAGAENTDDGRNVVIHEFAHQLDQENGQATGFPVLYGVELRRRWTTIFHHEYLRLQQQAHLQQPTLLNQYGATNPAEFFAVATEAFFEQAAPLSEQHPALYELLSKFYRVNPLSW